MSRLGLVFVCTSLWLVGAEARAFCRLTTAEPSTGGSTCSMAGRGLEWRRRCISYTVVPRDRADLDLDAIRDTIDASFSAWTDVTCGGRPLPLALGQTERLGACKTAQYNQFGPNANTIMFLDVWQGKDFPREAFGLTLVWHDPRTGEIFDADMQLNETIAPIAICSGTCDRNVVDLANVVTHEAGHFLGLGHSNIVGATMSANALLGETIKRTLEADDREGVCAIYGGNAAPACDGDAYAPDRGFSAVCGGAEADSSCSVARVGGATRSGSARLLASLGLLGLLGMGARRRARRP